jgi:DNA-binding PadR family transcriptional regulator
MSIAEPKLTSTAYAILGLIGLRPRTTHELSVAMQTNFDYFWPRARSLIYAEVKRLAKLGLLTAEQGFVGRRPRTTYAITPAGRAALATWLATPPRTFALELEGLLRLYLAPFGTREDLIHNLETVRDQAETMLRVAHEFQLAYLAGTSPAMDQVHLRALLIDFLANYAEFAWAWAERSLATVEAWNDLTPDGKGDAALATIAGVASPDGLSPPRGCN